MIQSATYDPTKKNGVDLGYSTVLPTLAIAKTADSNKWYLVLGSGPHGPNALKGESDQTAKISVVYLGGTDVNGKADVSDGLVNGDNKPIKPFRVYDQSVTPVISKTFELKQVRRGRRRGGRGSYCSNRFRFRSN